MVLAEGFIQWVFLAMREATIQSQSGHIQVVRPGYFRQGTANPFDYLLPSTSPALSRIESTPGVKLVAPRLKLTGLISHGDTTVSFIGEGVVPWPGTKLGSAAG
jgi:putative ABC transport system permease protein